MASKSGSGDRAESLGVRRPVELPETDMEGAGNLAPADSEPESGEAAGKDQEDAGAKAASGAGATAEVKEPAAETAAQAKGGQSFATATDVAVATPGADGDGDGNGMPPDRPKKPILAGVAIGGAIVLAVPILLIGTGSHHPKKHPTVAAADTVLPGDAQPPAGAFTSQSPTPTPTPTPSASAKKKVKPKDDKNAKKAAAKKKAAWSGVSNVLLRNAGSKMCADISGYGKGSPDDKVMQYYCTPGDADNQVWSLGVMRDMKGPGGTALFLIRNTKDDLCMDLPYYKGVSAGTKVTEYYCRPKGDNQLWYRSHTRGHLYRIRNYSSHGLCLGPIGRSHEHAKQLEVHKCGSGDEWSWPSGE
ncbi:RICIN domain-containing protein [Actinoallomurus sp. CA-142502]|uniref:RICIN domain-containing protein n=1 Tax=Actinoallomurus sp. CA-142502 TaxID=3239885 RepID=UPI003D930CB0